MALLHRQNTSTNSSLPQDNPFSPNSCTLDDFQLRPLPENDTNFDSPQKHPLFTHDIDFLNADSLYTIARGSLQIVPEPSAIELSEGKGQNCLPPSLKHSQSSLLFFEELESSDEEAQAKKLIVETHELTLRESSHELREDIINSPPMKRGRTQGRYGIRRSHHIKEVKALIRTLKRESKYREKIVADVILKGEGFTKRVKQAVITPVATLGGQLEGLLIYGPGEELKLRLVLGRKGSESKMQLWDDSLQNWLELQFKIRLSSP